MIMELTQPEQAVYDAELYDLAMKSLDNVWTRDADMVLDYYEYDMTKAELAREIEVSNTRVDQIIKKVTGRMKFKFKLIGEL
jgi:DNA-directed RNA polymerase specialized sigma subunit